MAKPWPIPNLEATSQSPTSLSPESDNNAEDAGKSRWFAVYTTSRHEKRVADRLAYRTIEHYLPLYRTQRRWKDGSRGMLDLPLFPGYIFVRIRRAERIRVLETPGVLWIVGSSVAQPTALPEFEIETLRAALDPLRVEPFPMLTSGQRVRIRAGALAGIEGIVDRQKNSLRVVVTLELIQQSIAVEVGADDLELVDRPTAAGMRGAAA